MFAKKTEEDRMFRHLAAMVFFFLSVTGAAAFFPGGYNYISAADLHKRLQAGEFPVLVDICPARQFAEGHIPGSVETNAFPVEKEEERQALATVLPRINASRDDVIIVCPRGGGGARRAYDFYKANGVAEKRILILEKGLEKWPYEKVKKQAGT